MRGVDGILNVDVIEPVIVAALVNGNDIVGLIDAVDSSQATTCMPTQELP